MCKYVCVGNPILGPSPNSSTAPPQARGALALDVAVGAAIDHATAGWPQAKSHATQLLLGWSGDPLVHWSLEGAAAQTSTTRETMRRAKVRVADSLAADPVVGSGADELAALLTALPGSAFGEAHGAAGQGDLRIRLDEVADQVAAAGLIRASHMLGPLIRALTAVGVELPVHLVPDGDDRPLGMLVAWSGMGTPRRGGDMTARLLGATADGRPHELLLVFESLGYTPEANWRSGYDDARQSARILLEDGRWRALSPTPSAQGLNRDLQVPDGLPRWVATFAGAADELPVPRALCRVLSITGPLPWADLLVAWGRGARHPTFPPLPPDVSVLEAWLATLPELTVRRAPLPDGGGDAFVEVVALTDGAHVSHDRTTTVLADVLSPHPRGLSRAQVLDVAAERGLKRSTTAAALTYHPAVVHAGRDLWSLLRSPLPELRGELEKRPSASNAPCVAFESLELPLERPAGPARRSRPVTYTWSPAGALVLAGQVPFQPSPVMYVPGPVRGYLEGRELRLHVAGSGPPPGRATGATVRVNGRNLWGFASALSDAGLRPGDPFELHCDLLASTATLTPSPARGSRP
jgi:hypothetical protein